MKKIILILIAIQIFTTSAAALDLSAVQLTQAEKEIAIDIIRGYSLDSVYTLQGIVDGLPEGEDVAYIRDSSGKRWMLEGREDLQVNDSVTMTIHSNDTETKTDDYILTAQYIGG